MTSAHQSNEELNKKMRNLRSRMDKLQGSQEMQAKLLEQKKEQAIALFGTDDIDAIRQRIAQIEDRNNKVIMYKTRVTNLCEQILNAIESRSIVPEELLIDLDKALANSTAHVAKLEQSQKAK